MELKPYQLLLGASFFAQLFGTWIALTILFCVEENGVAIWNAALGSSFTILYGMPMTVGIWFVFTLPISAICMHFKFIENVFVTTAIGIICGALLLNSSVIPGVGIGGFSLYPAMLGASTGGITGAGFCFLARVWGKRLPVE